MIVHQTRETLVDKLVSFGKKFTKNKKFIENSAIFDLESIGVHERTSEVQRQQRR